MKNLIFIAFIMSLFYYGNSSEATDKHLMGKLFSEDSSTSQPCWCKKKNNDIISIFKVNLINYSSSNYGWAMIVRQQDKNFKEIRNFDKENQLPKRRQSPLLTDKNSLPVPQLSSLEAREKKQRLEESMARFMQFLTFFGHVDNFLTQKTSGLLKIVGKAVGGDEYEDDYKPRYRPTRRLPPRIMTTISS